MSNFKDIFDTRFPIIAALHFLPLPGYEGHPGLDAVLRKALTDLSVLVDGGVNGIIVENNYDTPHSIIVEPETVAAMTVLTKSIVASTSLPVGVSVLWNDYKAAFSIAHLTGARFIRIPAFVDDVITDYGEVAAVSDKALEYRHKIGADSVAIFVDVQVKHAQMVDTSKTLGRSVKQAVEKRADAIIVTGRWTGDAPSMKKLNEARSADNDIPIIIGSGINSENIALLSGSSNGAIVSTSIKEGEIKTVSEEINLKPADAKFDLTAVKALVAAANALPR